MITVVVVMLEKRFEMVADAYYEILDDMEFGEEESENE